MKNTEIKNQLQVTNNDLFNNDLLHESDLAVQELIVVEGKNDAHAVRNALGKVDVIWTEGYGLTEEKLNYICQVAEKRGVIICTDPDFAGSQIRRRLLKRIPQAGQVYLSRAVAVKGNDIGLENVSPEEIRKAFTKVLRFRSTAAQPKEKNLITMQDIIQAGLVGTNGSAAKRKALGKIFGIGDTNAKQFLHRLNRLGVSREDLWRALKLIERNDQ
ncbi:MAG: ribonuclease M5 [Peptococcaceae bacterium]|nr:ribonuclease M5 [Peptococcaceae bacterium]